MVSGLSVNIAISGPAKTKQIAVPAAMMTAAQPQGDVVDAAHPPVLPGAKVVANQRAHPLDDAAGRQVEEGLQLVVDSQNHHIGLREGRQHGVERRDQQRGQRQIQRRRDADGVELFVKPGVGAQVSSAQPQRELDGAVDDKVDCQRHHLPDAGGQRRPANPHLREGGDAEDQHRVQAQCW